jgi:negative regulator of genetic competence, sporulation and motility
VIYRGTHLLPEGWLVYTICVGFSLVGCLAVRMLSERIGVGVRMRRSTGREKMREGRREKREKRKDKEKKERKKKKEKSEKGRKKIEKEREKETYVGSGGFRQST